jgi:hypothetical protein
MKIYYVVRAASGNRSFVCQYCIYYNGGNCMFNFDSPISCNSYFSITDAVNQFDYYQNGDEIEDEEEIKIFMG